MSSHKRSKWSTWEWSQEQGFYFRYTTDQYGQPDQFDYDLTGERAGATIPRSPAEGQPPWGAEQAPPDLSTLSIQDNQGDAYTTAPSGDGYHYGRGYGGTSKKKKSSKSKKPADRDQETDPPDPFYPPPADTGNAYSSAPITTGDETQPTDSGVPYDQYQAAQVGGFAPQEQSYGGGHHRKSRKGKDRAQSSSQALQDPPYAPPEDEFNDADFEAAINKSRNAAYMTGSASTGGSSSSDVPEPYYEPYPSGDPANNYVVEEASGDRTPRAASPQGSGSIGAPGNLIDIRGEPNVTGYSEQLDERYRVEPSHKFQPGEVFKVLWSEPVGQRGYGQQGRAADAADYGMTGMTDPSLRENFGERFYVGFRRFIVVANDLGHCTCVPILTYEHKGCRKKGVKPNKHGIVYQLGGRARMLEGEPHLGFPAVRLELYWSTEKIAKESRVNYSKLVTIEHNVKVLFIGRVCSEDFDIVTEAVNKCWSDKNHYRPSDRKHRK